MKTLLQYGRFLIFGFVLLTPKKAMASTASPSDVEINFQDLYVSSSTDCSSPRHVLHNASTATQNFVASPTLGSGSVPHGTYPCAIVGINSMITETPATSTTYCVAGTALPAQQICRNGQTSIDPGTGATITCVTGTAAEVFAYFSTTGSNGGGGGGGNNGFTPTSALSLSSPLVVTHDHTLQFVVDFDNTISDKFGGCNTDAPTMSAR